MSRIENTKKNFIWSTLSAILKSVLNFISRTVFLQILDIQYLGVNSLLSNVIALLSLTELGIGTAINYSLYKPLALNEIEKIKSLMHFYKKAYRMIAVIIACIGLLLLPFLDVIVKGAETIKHIDLIYLIFLFNTAYSYLFSYKSTLLGADQKSYLLSIVYMNVKIVTMVIQLVVLLVFKNYYIYIIAGVLIGIFQNFYINGFINKRYPYLRDKTYSKLNKNDVSALMKNIKSMLMHKIGELCIYQTDNIIISSFINVTAVGLLSNYNMIINTIHGFVMNIFNASTASLGHLIATEDEEKRLDIFNKYNFLAFWFFGWVALCFYILINPFIILWLGEELTVDTIVINLILVNYYLMGMRVPLGNIKAAAGVYAQDKFVPIIQAVINLVVSIIGVKLWGLPGVFLGTIISGILPCINRPIIVYKYVFNKKVNAYFIEYFIYMSVVIFNIILVNGLMHLILGDNQSVSAFIIKLITCIFLPNIIVALLYRNKAEFKYIKNLVITSFRKGLKR